VEQIQPVDMFPGTGHVETVVLLCRKFEEADRHISVTLKTEEGWRKDKRIDASYREIKEWVADNYGGMKVSSLYIAQVKRMHGIIERENYNLPKKKGKTLRCPSEKEEAIEEALIHFHLI